jgi:hypothetical protein
MSAEPSWAVDRFMPAARTTVRHALARSLPGGAERERAIEDEAEALADVLARAADEHLEDRREELRR